MHWYDTPQPQLHPIEWGRMIAQSTTAVPIASPSTPKNGTISPRPGLAPLDHTAGRLPHTGLAIPIATTFLFTRSIAKKPDAGGTAAEKAGSSPPTHRAEASSHSCAISPVSTMKPFDGTTAISSGKPPNDHDSPAKRMARISSRRHFLRGDLNGAGNTEPPALKSFPISTCPTSQDDHDTQRAQHTPSWSTIPRSHTELPDCHTRLSILRTTIRKHSLRRLYRTRAGSHHRPNHQAWPCANLRSHTTS
jgi:hypothetical protein